MVPRGLLVALPSLPSWKIRTVSGNLGRRRFLACLAFHGGFRGLCQESVIVAFTWTPYFAAGSSISISSFLLLTVEWDQSGLF